MPYLAGPTDTCKPFMSLIPTTEADVAREQQALVALSLAPGVGPGRIRLLVSHFGSAQAVLNASAHTLAGVSGIGPQTARAIAQFDDFATVDIQLKQAAQLGAVLVPAWDTRFPALLQQIYDPPAFLWVRGDLKVMGQPAIAIVGTRRATAYGRRVAHHFAYELAKRGFLIVSGLAYGVDTAAHEGALEAGGQTLAVMGTGVDRIYPRTNQHLARRIIEQGALVSEYALQSKPEAANFPRRNRIISGLSEGTLVAEAFLKGGALITARLALEQNREVFAVPSAMFSTSGAGNNQLIQDGHAKLTTSVDDILCELQPPSQSVVQPVSGPQAMPSELNPIEQKLWIAIGHEPIQIDMLCIQTGLDTSTALVYLLNLEFMGLIRQMAGKQFVRTRA